MLEVVVIVLLAACVVMLLALAGTIRKLQDQVESMEGQVLRLSEQVQEQEKMLEAMQAPEEDEEPGASGLVPFVGNLLGRDGKSPIAGLVLIGFQLIAAYLKRRALRESED